MLSVNANEKFNKSDQYDSNYGKDLEKSFLGVAHQQINPAISVEMSIYDTESFKKHNFGDNGHADNPKVVKVKKCTCALDKVSCPSHTDITIDDASSVSKKKSTTSQISLASKKSSASDDDLDKMFKNFHVPSELKLSLSSLSSETPALEKKSSDAVYENWLAEKNRLKKQIDDEKSLLHEVINKERERKIAADKVNFLKWIAIKEVEEKKKKEDLEKKKLEEQLAKMEKWKKEVENHLNYQLWLKRKEEQHLKQKLKSQMNKLNFTEEKKKRMERSAVAYQKWMKTSKNKPKPIPLNKGIESLRSSVSVSFINPQPWVPNIEVPPKDDYND